MLIIYYYNYFILYLCSYNKEYHSKKDDKIYTYWYKCSQDRSLAKRSRKSEDENKHRDTIPIERFDCNSAIKIIINTNVQQAMINYTHSILHKRPERYLINEETKEFINSQIHLSPAEIFGQLELKNPNITQKQIHY